MNRSRRNTLLRSMLAMAALVTNLELVAQEKEARRVINIQAKKFAYSPKQISVKQGENVLLEFNAIDFTHGFNIPDLHQRAELMAGQTIQLKLNTDKAGRYVFFCDNFCGDGHEGMNGVIEVVRVIS